MRSPEHLLNSEECELQSARGRELGEVGPSATKLGITVRCWVGRGVSFHPLQPVLSQLRCSAAGLLLVRVSACVIDLAIAGSGSTDVVPPLPAAHTTSWFMASGELRCG